MLKRPEQGLNGRLSSFYSTDSLSVLSRFGVEIDDELNESLKQKLAAKGAVQAGTIHFDL